MKFWIHAELQDIQHFGMGNFALWTQNDGLLAFKQLQSFSGILNSQYARLAFSKLWHCKYVGAALPLFTLLHLWRA